MNRLIKTEEEYEAALKIIEKLFDSAPGTPEGDELEYWIYLVEKYEDENYPIPELDPISAIKGAMELHNLKQADLIPYIGSKSKVSEVLSGKRPLSLNMIRNLSEGLHIPADILIKETEIRELPDSSILEKCKEFPFTEMYNKGYFADFFNGTLSKAKEVRDELLVKFIGSYDINNMSLAMDKKSDSKDSNKSALLAWRIRVMNLALQEELPLWDKCHLSEDIFQFMVHLSYFDKGPVLAKEYLNKLGIHVIFEPQLDKTYLDGSSFFMPDGSPVIALTLRHDRLDSFWFTLCHEISHLMLHFDADTKQAFFDDLTVLDKTHKEKEADSYAGRLLIPEEKWKKAKLSINSTPGQILKFAEAEKISPSIPAGRIRYETKNYKVFSSLVGSGTVRKMF